MRRPGSGKDRLVVLASLGAGILLWEFGTRRLSPAVAAPFSATMSRLWEMTVSGELPSTLVGSLVLFAVGLGMAVVVALPLGLLLARLPVVRIALSDYIALGNAMPMVALIPFILSLFGLDFGAKVLVVAAGLLRFNCAPAPVKLMSLTFVNDRTFTCAASATEIFAPPVAVTTDHRLV